MSDALERALARLRGGGNIIDDAPEAPLPAATFRAVIEERLRNLDRQLDEVKGRVNGLIFLLVGAVAAQLILQLVR